MSESAELLDIGQVLDLLRIGLPIEVQVPMPDPEQSNVFFSQIMDCDASSLQISAPQHRGQRVDILLDGDPIYLRFSHEGVAYTCECRKLGWVHQPEGMRVSLPEQIERIQRRHFVRVDAELPVTLMLQLPDGAEVLLQTRTTDLSGGGMLITAERELPLYLDAELILSLPPEQPGPQAELLRLKAQICRLLRKDERFQIGLSFMNISEPQRDRLIRYIFRYQRESLKAKPYQR